MRGALKDVAGVSAIAIKEGDKDFSVTYDPSRITPADMVAKLKAAGEAGAKIKS